MALLFIRVHQFSRSRCHLQHVFLYPLILHLLLLLLVIWPNSGHIFGVPVQLLGDDMMHVNNSTVPLCWTGVMLTVLAQQAAFFRGYIRLSSSSSRAKAFTGNSSDLLLWFLLLLRNSPHICICSVQDVALASVIGAGTNGMSSTFLTGF